MSISRRGFLKLAGSIGVALAIPVINVRSSPANVIQTSPTTLTVSASGREYLIEPGDIIEFQNDSNQYVVQYMNEVNSFAIKPSKMRYQCNG